MDKFDEGGGSNGVLVVVGTESATQQGQQRAEALAAVADGVLHHQFRQRHFRPHFSLHQRFGLCHFALDELPDCCVVHLCSHEVVTELKGKVAL